MDKLRTWLQSLTQQQRILFLVLFIIVAYFIWSLLWGKYYSDEQKRRAAQLKDIQDKITLVHDAQQKMKALALNPDVLATQKKIDDLRKQLDDISRRLVPAKQMLEQLQGMLTKDPDIQFAHVQNAGTIPLSIESNQVSNNNQSSSEDASKAALVPSFYQHVFIISFEANYFATQRYIEQLQQLKGQLYFDSIEYTVGKYPLANVSLKVHTISLDPELINA